MKMQDVNGREGNALTRFEMEEKKTRGKGESARRLGREMERSFEEGDKKKKQGFKAYGPECVRTSNKLVRTRGSTHPYK